MGDAEWRNFPKAAIRDCIEHKVQTLRKKHQEEFMQCLEPTLLFKNVIGNITSFPWNQNELIWSRIKSLPILPSEHIQPPKLLGARSCKYSLLFEKINTYLS